jgi:hypothetical protein
MYSEIGVNCYIRSFHKLQFFKRIDKLHLSVDDGVLNAVIEIGREPRKILLAMREALRYRFYEIWKVAMKVRVLLELDLSLLLIYVN